MTHPLLTRAHLEALIVATAVAQRDRARAILADVDRDRISPAAWSLLSQLAETEESRKLAGVMFPQLDTVYATTDQARRLADRVDAITIGDLCFFEYSTLVALVNQLPERASAPAAWERDLARAGAAG